MTGRTYAVLARRSAASQLGPAERYVVDRDGNRYEWDTRAGAMLAADEMFSRAGSPNTTFVVVDPFVWESGPDSRVGRLARGLDVPTGPNERRIAREGWPS